MRAAADKDNMTVEDPLGSNEEDEGSEDEEDGASGSEEEEDDDDEGGRLLKATLEARQAARAAGDHPLQESFRAAAAQLLEKYATADKKKRKKKDHDPHREGTSLNEEEEQQDNGEEEEDEEEAEGEEEGAPGSSEEDEQVASSGASSSDDGHDLEESNQPAATQLGDAQRTDRQQAHAEAQTSGQTHADLSHADDNVDDIPYTIAAPSSYAAFAELAKGQGPARLGLIIQRIRACNAIALATDNRRKLQASTRLSMAWPAYLHIAARLDTAVLMISAESRMMQVA